LQTVLVGTEHILMEQEVSTEEDQEGLQVYDLRVLSGADKS